VPREALPPHHANCMLWMRAELREGGELLAATRSLFLEVEAEHFARGVEESDAERGLGFPW
jgi:hypothetical protein